MNTTQSVERAAQWLREADCVLIGGGAGASTEAGMSTILTTLYSSHEHHTWHDLRMNQAQRSITQHHAAPRSTTQHYPASSSTTQHHTAPASIIQHHPASPNITLALHSRSHHLKHTQITINLFHRK